MILKTRCVFILLNGNVLKVSLRVKVPPSEFRGDMSLSKK